MEMKFIEYFSSENKEHWLAKIDSCDWDAGKYLAHLENLLTKAVFKRRHTLFYRAPYPFTVPDGSRCRKGVGLTRHIEYLRTEKRA